MAQSTVRAGARPDSAQAPDGRRSAGRLRTVAWRPGGGRRVALPVGRAAGDPADGSPRLLVAVLTTTAPGRPTGVRTLVMRLVAPL